MAPNSPITDDDRQRVAKALADRLIYGLEQGELLRDSSADAADFILLRLPQITTHEQMTIFLQEVASKWPVFMSVYQDEKKTDIIGQIEVELNQMSQAQPK